MKRQLHLNLFIHSRGHHEASWRHPLSSPLALTDIRYYQDLAQRAEAGLFDSIFLADQLALGDDASQAARTWLEPVTVLAAVAAVTSRIGLIATASTTYTEPFNLARQFGSLDHISNGRVGWNIVTSWLATAARNFGGTGQVSHDDRYAQGEEFMTVIKGLWDSWAEDAVIDDRAGGRYAKADRIRPINHKGEHYQVAGPLNLPRTPAGPAGAGAGRIVRRRPQVCRAARRSGVHRAHGEEDRAGVLRRSQAARGGGGAKARAGADPAGTEPDDRLDASRGGAHDARDQRTVRPRGRAEAPVRPVRRARLLASAARPSADAGGFPRPRLGAGGAQPHRGDPEPGAAREADACGSCWRTSPARAAISRVAGTPEQVADIIEDWFSDGAADGFNIMPPLLPAMLDVFSAEVIPILQKRGLFRTSYEGKTLREHYGLDWPASAFKQAALQEA